MQPTTQQIRDMMECMDRADIPQKDRIARYYDTGEQMVKEVELALSNGEWDIV